jgi:hypothetical protein
MRERVALWLEWVLCITIGSCLLYGVINSVKSDASSAVPVVAPAIWDSMPRTLMTTSYYGEELRGRLTASGTPFNPDEFTCAHKTLPFGTWLLVGLRERGLWIRVQVTDRGPYVFDKEGRSIRELDLSLAAARALELEHSGVGFFEVHRLTQVHDIFRLEQSLYD